jgi:Radical SAM superfamily/Iron-sulfur cluster-binding domain
MADVLTAVEVSPYLHFTPDGAYNPTTGERIGTEHPDYALLLALRDAGRNGVDPAAVERLRAQRFIIEDLVAESHRTHLLCVSLETCSVCNHRCGFCPVSRDPRGRQVMEPALFESIVDQLGAFTTKDTVVFLNNYNEPTVDPLFLDRCRYLFRKGLPVSLLTNASGLTPEVAREISSIGRFRYLGVNLPTLDVERYRASHGTKDLPRVVANIDALGSLEIAEERAIVVLGDCGEIHKADEAEIAARYGPAGWQIKSFEVRSRAGQIPMGRVVPYKKKLRGCELMGSRPFEHLHVNANARAVLCCQDYYESWTVGDLTVQTVAEVLGGETLARLRRWAYGVEEAPENFICRRCEFALGE